MDAGLSTLITGLAYGLGIGAVVTALIQYALKRKEAAYDSQRKDLEARYRVVILLMYAAVDFEVNRASFRINRPDLTTKQLVLDELKAEWHNMILFASSETIKTLQTFIAQPSRPNLFQAALAMRVDLGRGGVTVGEDV
jgi:hypothetical protein